MGKLLDPTKDDFHTGLAASMLVTVMSELGDKTFIMSAILAMHHSRTLTLIGSVLAQVIMTVIAVSLGMAASLVPEVYTKWASCICMTFFGLKMLKDGFSMPVEEEEIYLNEDESFKTLDEKVSTKYNQIDDISKHKEMVNSQDDTLQSTVESVNSNKIEENQSKPSSRQGSRRNSRHGVLLEAFTLSFLGEWGDRSQIATILLASNENPYGVAVGSILGHTLCSLVAVMGGRLIGQRFPVKTMTQVGGIVFLLCAASSFVFE